MSRHMRGERLCDSIRHLGRKYHHATEIPPKKQRDDWKVDSGVKELRTRDALGDDLGWIPSTHTADNNGL